LLSTVLGLLSSTVDSAGSHSLRSCWPSLVRIKGMFCVRKGNLNPWWQCYTSKFD